jgi:hypothetical protein
MHNTIHLSLLDDMDQRQPGPVSTPDAVTVPAVGCALTIACRSEGVLNDQGWDPECKMQSFLRLMCLTHK